MSLGHGAKIVTDGLKFAYDMGSKQSWKGKPTTNLVNQPTTAFSNWSGFTGTSTLRTTRQGRNRVHLIGTASGGVQWYNTGGQKVVTPSTEYTVSATIKYDGTTPHPNLFYIRQYNSSGSQTSENGKFSTSYMTPLGDGWYRAYRTFITDSTAVRALVQGYQYAAPCNIQIQDVQLELGNINSPYVDGTRSNTEALIDWTGNNTIIANSLTYSSDNTFEFTNTSNNYATATGSGLINGMTQYTIAFWARRDVESKMPVATVQDTQFYWYGDNSWRYTHGGTGGEYYYPKSVSIPLGTWGYYVATYDGSNVRIYRNGVYEGAKATTGTANWAQGIRIGGWASSSSYAYDGIIGAVNFYDRALTGQEIKQNFNALRGRYGI